MHITTVTKCPDELITLDQMPPRSVGVIEDPLSSYHHGSVVLSSYDGQLVWKVSNGDRWNVAEHQRATAAGEAVSSMPKVRLLPPGAEITIKVGSKR